MSTLFQNITSGADFSPCRRYRYRLWRVWDDKKPILLFIGLNPSTANETATDNTLTRVVGFAKSWGYGGVYLMNLFALVDKSPKALTKSTDPLGENDKWLSDMRPACATVLFAWGTFKAARLRGEAVAKMFPDAICLAHNNDYSPLHPLYAKGDLQPILYREPEKP